MAEDAADTYWNSLIETLKRLSSTTLASNEDVWRKEFLYTCNEICNSENDFLGSNQPDVDRFLSQVIALSANLISVIWLDYDHQPVLNKICKVIVLFCLKHIQNSTGTLLLTKLQLVHIIEKLCKSQLCFSKDELTTIQCAELDIPENLPAKKTELRPADDKVESILEKLTLVTSIDGGSKDKIEQKRSISDYIAALMWKENGAEIILNGILDFEHLSDMSKKYNSYLEESSSSDSVILQTNSIWLLADELSLVKEVIGLPFMEPLSTNITKLLFQISEKTTKAALFLASGIYDVDKAEVSLLNGNTMKSEDFCRKFGWKSTEHSLAILDHVFSVLSLSTRIDNYVSLNLQIQCVITILNGLKSILLKDQCKSTEKKETWKWFEGLNIMLITMTSRVMSLLSNLVDQLKAERTQSSSSAVDIDELDMFTRYTSLQQLQFILKKLPLPELLIELFIASHTKGIQLSQLASRDQIETTEDLKNDDDSKKKADSSGDDSSAEEGSMFGNIFAQNLTDSVKSPGEEKFEKKNEDALAQSGEIFHLLASSLLEFSTKFFQVCNEKGFLTDVVSAFSDDHIKELASVLEQETQPEILVYVTKLLCNLITDGVISGSRQNTLLEALNIHLSQSHWPLKLSCHTLAIFIRVVLKEFTNTEVDDPVYIKMAWKLYIRSLLLAATEGEVDSTNVEYTQVMVVLFHLLPSEARMEIIEICLKAIMQLSKELIISSVHGCHLMLLLEYFIHHNSEKPKELLTLQVQKNVLLSMSSEEKHTPAYLPCRYEDGIAFKNHLPVSQESPVFFELDDVKKTDQKVISAVFRSATVNYMEFYESFLNLMSNLLTEINERNSHDLRHGLGLRNMFLRMWALLKVLPVPADALTSLSKITELQRSHNAYLFYLCWMPALFELKKEDILNDINVVYTSDEQTEKEINEIMESLLNLSIDPTNVFEYAQKLIPLVTNLFNCQNTLNFIPYVVADGLIMFLWLLLKKYVLEQKDRKYDGEVVTNLLLDVVYLLKVEVEKSKELIIRHATAGTEISKDQFNFYLDIVGIDLPEPADGNRTHNQVEVSEPAFLQILAPSFKETFKKWNQLEVESNSKLIPRLFNGLELNVGAKNPEIGVVIDACITSVISAHMKVACAELPYMAAASSLKRCVRTLADVCEELFPWMQENLSSDFEKVKAVGMSKFSFLWVDHVAAHISTQCENLMMLCLDEPGQDKLEIIVFVRMLEIIEKWMVEELPDANIVDENVLISWMGFLTRMIDHSKTLSIFMQYYMKHEDSLLKLFSSIIKSHFSDQYISAYMALFTKIFNLREESNAENIKLSLLKICHEDEAEMTQWIRRMLISQGLASNGCSLLRTIINCCVQNRLCLDVFLEGLINVCSEILDKVINETEILLANFTFSNIFDIITIVATACNERGHLRLFKSVLQWLVEYQNTWMKSLSSEENLPKNRIRECCNTLALYVTKLISTTLADTEGTVKEETLNRRDIFDMMDFSDITNVNEEDISNAEESDDDTAGKVCTFTVTQRDFIHQHWYHCHTCKMNDGVGCCTQCAKVCHKGHDVTYSKHGSFFCDCGAKEDGSCKAMTKTGSSAVANQKSVSPFTAWGEPTTKASHTNKNLALSSEKGDPTALQHQTEDIFLLKQIMKDSKADLQKLLKNSGTLDVLLDLLGEANVAFKEEVVKIKKKIQMEKDSRITTMESLYSNKKICQNVDNLMNAVSGSQEGAFENIKLNYGGDQGQMLRQLMSAHVIYHKAMCLIASPRGRRQHLAVAHGKGKVTILQMSGLLKPPEANQKKTTLNRLTSTVMPFTVLHMSSNAMNDDFLAVTGLKDCHVLTLGHSGTPVHLALSPKLETGNYIIKAVWVPGSQTKLGLVTADFVKIYDLSESERESTHHFVLPSGKVRDATFIQSNGNASIAVMSSQGHIYTEKLNEASSAGPFYMMNVLTVTHTDVEDTGSGLLNGGGVSVYYSQLMKLLFFSYSKGKSFIGALDKNITQFEEIFTITTSSPLIQMSEVPGQFGLIHCIQQNTGNILVLALKTDKILIQEVKSPSKSSKVQSAVCCHHSVNDNKDKAATSYKTTLIVLLDDGSLRIYNANQEQAEFLPKKNMLPSTLVGSEVAAPKKDKLSKPLSKVNVRSKNRFPVDFFEHCQVTNDVEFGGTDILHVYNKNQVKNRLNAAGMYIANTKQAGFKVEISHTNSSSVIVGIRVQVGVQSMERSPQYVEILGRIIQMRMAKNRWFDIPLTHEESVTVAEKNKVTVIFGPSSDPYGLSIVDSIKVYTKSKEAFGYNEESPAVNQTNVNETTQSTDVSIQYERKRPSSYLELLFGTLLATANKCISILQFETNESSPMFTKLLAISSDLVATDPQFYSQQSLLGQQTLHLLRSLYSCDAKYHNMKDELQVSYLLRTFHDAENDIGESNQLNAQIMATFLLVLSIFESIGAARPENLVKYLSVSENIPAFADSLITTLHKLHTSINAESNSLNLNKQELSQLGHLVELIIEVLFSLMLGDSSLIEHMSKLIISLLLDEDQCVSFAAKQGLVKALQSRQTILTPVSSVCKEADDDVEKKTENDESATPTQEEQADVPEDIQPQDDMGIEDANIYEGEVDEDDDGIVIDENEIMNNGDLQMFLDDDNAMMEIALALSLQNQQGQGNSQNEEDSNVAEQELLLVQGDEDNDNDDEPDDEEDGDDDDEVGAEAMDIDEDNDEDEELRAADQDDHRETLIDNDEADIDVSDGGQDSFTEALTFIENTNLISTEKPDSTFRLLWNKLLCIFNEKIPDLMELNGLQVIPFLQVFLILCSNLSESEEDQLVLKDVISACVRPLEMQQQDASKVAERNEKHEVQLVLMRFLSVLMSRCTTSKQESSNETKTFDSHVAKLLSEAGLIDHCLFLLKNLHTHWQNIKIAGDDGSSINSTETNNLLQIKPLLPTPDMMPFFMEQYVKSHALDLFEAFPQLVTEMILRVPYQIHKLMDGGAEEKYFDKDWTFILCEYMLMQHTPFVRRQVRKLLLALCGTKEKYRYIKDLHNLRSHLSHLRELLHVSGIVLGDASTRIISLSYEQTVSLTENITCCIEIATSRNENWQSFCRKEKAILPFLLQASYQVTGLVSAKIIDLVSLALTKASSKKLEKSEKKEKNKAQTLELINHVFSRCFGPTLTSFIKHFLLESNSTQLRWKVHHLIHIIYQSISAEQQCHLIELMWNLWDVLPSYGHLGSQFVDLLGYFTVKTDHKKLKNKLSHYVSCVMNTLKEGNTSLKNHPNANLYRKLQNYVKLDGFYLESDPCIVCNNPEIVFNSYKLSAMKSDIRYTTKSQIIKLASNHTISKINLKVSDIKRAKMVKTINIFYNNKLVPSVVELKNKPGVWQKAKKINLVQGQTEVKVELTFPITAYNLMIEFAEFYDNAQFSSETLQCPRCSASVPAHPGICSNCGENVYQCHKCRAINYDEKDPFLCTSCGFCKYAKFEFTLNSHPCTSVEPINNEEDRDKALKTVNSSLEKADQYYQQLSVHRQTLETLLKSVKDRNIVNEKNATQSNGSMVWNISSLISGSNSQNASSSALAMASINQSIQGVAHRYSVDCKTAFEEMSKVTQTVTATRKELAQYDIKQKETLSQAIYASPDVLASPSASSGPPVFSRLPSFTTAVVEEVSIANKRKAERHISTFSKCYGCSLSSIHHCLTLLRALSTLKTTHEQMLDAGLLHELVEHNLQQRLLEVVSLAQTLLIQLTSENQSANAKLNDIICNRISLCLSTQAANMLSEISLHSELSVLKESIISDDSLWEERFKCVFMLFLDSLQHRSPEILEAVTLPCLEIIEGCMKPKQPDNKKVIQVNKPPAKERPANALKWLQGSPDCSLGTWNQSKSESKQDTRPVYLMKKYGRKWLGKVRQKVNKTPSVSVLNGWLRILLFTPASSAMRSIVCNIIKTLAETPAKKQMILHLLMSYLNELHVSGENAVDYLNLFKSMLSKSEWKVYLCHFGILDHLCELLSQEVDYLSSLENSTLNFDLAQGYALFAFAELLKSFLEDEEVKVLYRGRFVAEVLQCYLVLRKLVVQRTKLLDESQEILLALLHQLTSGTEKSAFMKTCVDALKKCPVNDIRTPVFIFEQLCNVIHKEEEENTEFFMLLDKDPQQEDYLQGRMQGNPYSSKEQGLGPLMRDLKNKICTECELVALLEDDTGMELLVNNKIISLDLPVNQVYRKIWSGGKNENKEPMKVIYRMRGLLGDATEDMVENLDSDKEKDIDEESEYERAGLMIGIGGLEVVLKRLSFVRDLSRAQPLISVILKLLEYCVKVKVNREYLHRPSVNAMKVMLSTLNLALRLERDHGSSSGGATIAERILKIMEIILHEATTDADVKEVVVMTGEESQLELLLNHITSPYVRSNPNVLQAMMRLTPFLTFGSEDTMHTLIDHFMPFFDFDNFDKEKSPDTVLHLECFRMIADGISKSPSGSKLKDLIIKRGMVSTAMQYLHRHAPPKSFRASGILDSAKWKDFLAKPSLPYILRILTGLINGHTGTEAKLGSDETVGLLHHLEQISSEVGVGSLAENLLEAIREFPEGKKKVGEVRRKTRNEKKSLAMAMRQKQLEALGMEVSSTGHIKAKPSSTNKEMKELLEEKEQRLFCCICREGYQFYPNKVLGIYTFTLRCVLDEYENKQKRSHGYTTVSHFNVIHFDCHLEAVRHARSRDEWESAALQNGNVKCNGLIPIWGPKVSESSFATCLARHNNYIQECTGFREPTFHSTVHDIRLMLCRFAYQKSFSSEAGGGGKISNMYLLPYMIHIALYVLNTTRQRVNEEQMIKSFLDAPVDTWIGSCYEVNGPLFTTALSLFVIPLKEWVEKKVIFLKRLLLLAHVRNTSKTPMHKLTSAVVKEYSVYKPMLLFFYLVDQLQDLCKAKLSGDEDWSQTMSTYLCNNDDGILKDAEKILKCYEEDLVPCETFNEFLDVTGLLSDIPDGNEFVKQLLVPYSSTENEVFC